MTNKLASLSFSLLCAFGLSACVTHDAYDDKKEVSSSTIGAVSGAVAGAVLGNQVKGNKNTRQNARLAGAAIGGLVGGGLGNYMDKQEAELRQELKGSGVSVTRKGDLVVLNMPGNITFDTAQSRIQDDFTPVLSSVAKVIKKFDDTQVEIAGHTDAKGTSQNNQVLSLQRSEAVASYLRQQGVADKRLRAAGYGASQPLADNTTEEGRAANRRVEIVLTPKGK